MNKMQSETANFASGAATLQTENFVKVGRAIFEICDRKKPTDNKHTDRHADCNISPPTGGEIIKNTFAIRS